MKNHTLVQAHFAAHGLPEPVAEHKFAIHIGYYDKRGTFRYRQWAFDFAWLEYKVALEIEGGVFSGGRHTRGGGFAKDMEKYNTATVLGWRILRVMPGQVFKTETAEMVRKVIEL